MPYLSLFASPAAWAALATLIVMEVVLGVDNLLFLSIVTNKLPPAARPRARRLGLGGALVLRLALLSAIAWLAGLTEPVVDLGIAGAPGAHGEPTFETALSWRDMILIAGGLFLVWKATGEIHGAVEGRAHGAGTGDARVRPLGIGAAIAQILALDLVFSIDSILTAIGMTDQLPVMIVAVVVAVGIMALAADPVSRFVARHPGVVMLALAFLLAIGLVLIADGFGVHVPKGYIYAAMAFAAIVEALNIAARRPVEDGAPRR